MRSIGSGVLFELKRELNMQKREHDKQHDMRSATLDRIAKSLRQKIKNCKSPETQASKICAATLKYLAESLEAEANLLRSMR